MSRITIKEIARESGYSIGTVSRALNHAPGVSETAKEAIFKVVDKYGFESNPNAKFLKQKNRSGIAVLVRDAQSRILEILAASICLLLSEKGYAVTRVYTDIDQDEALEALKICEQRAVQGLIVLGADRRNLQKSFSRLKVPCVVAGASTLNLPFRNLSSVSTEDSAAALEAIEYLFSIGHRRIGIIGCDVSRSSVFKDRLHGVQYAFYSRSLPFHLEELYVSTEVSMEGGYQGLKALLEKMPDATAVFCMTDMQAVGALRAAKDLGLQVPENLSILGFDGLEAADYTVPRLSTIEQDTETIARRAVTLLTRSLNSPFDRPEPVCEFVPFTLAIKESTAPLAEEKEREKKA